MKQIKYLILSLVIFVLSTFNVTQAKPYSAKDMKCLYDATYHEARGESIKGMIGVVYVILNRVGNDSFPNTPCSVVHQRGQFSWVGKGYTIKDKEQYERSKEVVHSVLDGKYKDPTGKAIFFNSHHKAPTKTAKCAARIGNHSFWK